MDIDKQRVAELVVEIQNGNSNAFNELYKLTSSRAYFVALQITKNEEDAQDILQDCYIKALEKISSLDKPESFVSWFHQMVANKSKDYLKKKKPTLFEGGEDEAFEIIPDEDEEFIPESNLDKTELQNAIMEAINELSDDKRACVLMMYFEEMSVNEIAQTLEVPVSTVKNRLFTARKDLKNSFAKRGITSLYSAAPIGAVIWALRGLSDSVSKTFAGSAASTQVLSGVASATAGTAAASAGSAAAAGTGIAAKVAAFSITQKAVAGIVVAAGVVTGSALGVTTAMKNNKETETTTQFYAEEVTTAPEEAESAVAIISETETSLVVSLSSTVNSTAVSSTKKEPTATAKFSTTVRETTAPKTTKPTTTKKETTRNSTTVTTTTTTTTTTTKPTTTVTSTTEKTTVTTTKATTKAATKATTSKPTTSKPTTTEPTTTEAPTTTTTTATATETTTKKQTATVNINVIDYDGNPVASISVEVEPGTELTWDYLMELVRSKGYEAKSGVFGDVGGTAEAGETYEVDAEL